MRDIIQQQDYIRIADMLSAVQPRPVTASDMLKEWGAGPAGQVLRERVADGPDGAVIGYSRVFRLPWWSPGRFNLFVLVDPAHSGRGLGSRLYTEACAAAEAAGATRLETDITDTDERSFGFAQRRGFRVDRHLFNSWLDVESFDPAPFAGVLGAVQAEGIRFFTMADAGDSEEARRRMYEVNRAAALDIPGREPTFSDFAQYQKRHMAPGAYRPELQLIAADGDRWVGLAGMVMHGPVLHNRMTGVIAPYRGRRIALALKLLAIETARRLGVARLTTNNDSENGPMLAVNRKLGYQPEPGVYMMMKTYQF